MDRKKREKKKEKQAKYVPDKKATDVKNKDVTAEIIRRLRETLTLLNQAMSDITSDLFRRPESISMEVEVDMFESDGLLVVEAVIPGVEIEDLKVKIKQNIIFLRGEIFASEDLDEEEVFISERYYGPFKRTITLPYVVNPLEADVFYRSGILRIELPIGEEESEYPETDLKIESE